MQLPGPAAVTSLLADVAGVLERRVSPYAVVGAAALAVRGVSRSTLDLDILTTDRAVLRREVWSEIETAGTEVDVRIGDISDPLVGVVRLSRTDERPVDVIVGEGSWQERILAEAQLHTVVGVDLPVVDPVGFVLLKLYAGGPQDLWDVHQLLAAVADREGLAHTVRERLVDLPARSRKLWERVRAE